jgi:hypothetical protein
MPDIPSSPIEDKLAKFAESLRAHRPGITDEQILQLFYTASQIGQRFNVDAEGAMTGLAGIQSEVEKVRLQRRERELQASIQTIDNICNTAGEDYTVDRLVNEIRTICSIDLPPKEA